MERRVERVERRVALYRRPGFLRALAPIALLVIWQVASSSGWVSAKKLPAPSVVLDAGLEIYRSRLRTGRRLQTCSVDVLTAVDGRLVARALGVYKVG